MVQEAKWRKQKTDGAFKYMQKSDKKITWPRICTC